MLRTGTAAVLKTPIDDIDSLFVPVYKVRVAALKAEQLPYVEAFGSSLTLYPHGQPSLSVKVLVNPYHHLKDIAHVPFMVYLSLRGFQGSSLSNDQLAGLRLLLTKLTVGREALSSSGFDPEQLNRQREILAASISFVQEVLTNRTVDQSGLNRFARAMAPLMLKDADEAGCIQVQATHNQMMLWKPLLSRQEWQDLRVVIKNSHQARYRNADTQYFSWLLGGSSPTWALKGESSKVLYAETLFGTQTDEDELLAVQVDFDASQTFFGDDWRMSEDILSDGAARCIAQLSPTDRTWTPPAGTSK